jgi:hypothetical protein
MKTIETKNTKCEIFGTKITIILVNGIEVISLSPLGKNSGFDSRAKYLVHQISKEVVYWNKTARSIKDVVNYISK